MKEEFLTKDTLSSNKIAKHEGKRIMRRATILLAAIAICVQIQNVGAAVVPSKMFTDNMVLQCDMKVPVWGTADAGEKVTVEFAGQKKEVTADKDGKWTLKLDPLKISAEGRILKISGKELANVLVGEVWIGSGQSNMAGGTGGYAKRDPELTKMMTGGPYPTLRLYKGGWKVADEASIKSFSALHFAFGRSLHEKLKVPVGLMVGAVGGTPSGRWLTEEMCDADEAVVKARKIEADKQAKVQKPQTDGKKPKRHQRKANIGDLYKRHIEYMVPYGIRGVLWDQGESRVRIPGVDQITCMNALITGWRNVWAQGDFHFLHVQKPSGEGCAWDYENPVNRLAMPFGKLPGSHTTNPGALKYELDHIKIATLKNAPIVPASDLAPGIHPQNKSGYGKRACQVALGTVYGHDVAICGPVYKSHKVAGKTIRVEYNHVGKGLAFKNGEALQGFEIAGKDGKWEWADAKIDGGAVVLSSENIAEPVNVQYAFNKRHTYANLFNKDGLPALMFTTVEH